MNDNDDVLGRARDALPPVHMDRPVETIMARGRAWQRRRLATVGVAGIASAAVVVAGLAGVLGSGAAAPAHARNVIHTDAFTLVSNSNGTDSLTLTQGQVFNPGELQQALTQDGIPALVTSGQICRSDPQPSAPGVLSVQLPDGQPVPKSSPGSGHQGDAQPTSPVPNDAVTVINPSALPTGAELFFSYSNSGRTVEFGVIEQASHTCSPAGPGSPGNSGSSGSSGNS